MHENQIMRYMMSKRYIEDKYVCWDFVIDVIKDMYGITLPEYPVGDVQAEFKNKLVANFKHIKVEDGQAQEGDIVVFSLFANQHAGVMIDSETFIHLRQEGVQVSELANLGKNYVIYRMVR